MEETYLSSKTSLRLAGRKRTPFHLRHHGIHVHKALTSLLGGRCDPHASLERQELDASTSFELTNTARKPTGLTAYSRSDRQLMRLRMRLLGLPPLRLRSARSAGSSHRNKREAGDAIGSHSTPDHICPQTLPVTDSSRNSFDDDTHRPWAGKR